MCQKAVCYIEIGSETRLTQLHGRAATELGVHHRNSWKLTNQQSNTGRGDQAATRWCWVRMTDGLLVALFWIEPTHSPWDTARRAVTTASNMGFKFQG
eukprot:SAG31_NODE_3955_length_3720_cov_1.847556_1_plen_98_part_00